MSIVHDPLDELAEKLTPVRPLDTIRPASLIVGLTLAGTLLVWFVLGPRSAFGAGFGSPFFILRTAMLLLLGCASLFAVTAMARPAIGRSVGGWRWVIGAGAIVPVAALAFALASRDPVSARLVPADGLECLGWSIGLGLVLGAALTDWLRRGAPTSPQRAGTAIGVAAGSFGALAYSIHCPHDDIVYIGLWYTLAIAAMTLAGRILLPRFLRW